MLRSSLVLLSLVISLTLSAAEFQFDDAGVTASVTPFATTYWSCACTGTHSGLALFAHRQAIIEDSDGDGIVRWEQGKQMLLGMYTMIDGTSGSITTRMSHNSAELDPLVFPAKAFLRDENGLYSRFVVNALKDFPNADLLHFLWVRPGVGAWSYSVVDQGGADELEKTLFKVMFDVRSMRTVGSSPAAPTGLKAGDFFVMQDYRAGWWIGDLVDSHLGEAVGGGVIVHAKTAGSEDDGKMTITLARTEGTDDAASVHYETVDETAKAGVHYQASSGTVVFDPGHIFSSFEVPVIDDQIDAIPPYQLGVTFRVTLSDPSGATIGTPSLYVTIPDNDDLPYVILETFSIPEGDGGPREVPMTVALNHSAPKPVTLHWEVQDRFTNETLESGVLDFAVGEKQKPVAIHYIADDVYGFPKSWRVVITYAVNASRWREGRLTIVEDDPPPTMTVTGTTVNESQGTATVTVRWSEPLTFSYGVLYSTEDGSATSPADYTGITEFNAVIEAGSTTATIAIPIHNDTVAEGTESFRVHVWAFGAQDEIATVTILDDEGPPGVAIEQITVSEGGRGPNAIPVEVTLSHPAPKPVILEWKAYDLVTNLAVDTGVLQFGVGERVRSLNVRYVADDLWGLDRQLGVVITKAMNATVTTEGRVTIIEDELPPAITAAGVTVREGDGLTVIDVALSEPVRDPIRVTYRAYGRTAVPFQDFVSTAGELLIPAGSTIGTINVPIVNDSVAEEPESFTVVIEAAMIATAPITATATILDDDAQGRRRSMRR